MNNDIVVIVLIIIVIIHLSRPEALLWCEVRGAVYN